MKTNYPLKSRNFEERQKAARQRTVLVILGLAVALAILSTTVAKDALFFIARPVWSLENVVVNFGRHLGDFFQSKQVLINENQAMQDKIFAAGTLSDLNNVLQAENDRLKDLLGRKDTKQKSVLGVVLVKPPQNLYDILTIDAGTDQGIKVGDRVMADGQVYIGEVSEVYPNTAKVILYSSPGQKLQVSLGADSVGAEAVGRGGGNFSINLPREVAVKEGDEIVVPSITPNVFGIIEQVQSQDKDSFQTILFKSPVNIATLNFVEVIL